MSLLGEIFAKEFAKDKGIDWRRVMQVLASYNWENGNFDVRLKLSGLEDMKEKILYGFFEFLLNSKNTYYETDKSKVFAWVGDEKEIGERIKTELEKKRKIQPVLIKNAEKFTNELIRELCVLDPIVFLRGSASPNCPKIFWYYKLKDEIIFISDIDLEFVLHYFDEEILKYVKNKAYRLSLTNKIPINVHFSELSSMDEGIFNYGYPLLIPYRLF
jgi:uncharacterized protein YuzE